MRQSSNIKKFLATCCSALMAAGLLASAPGIWAEEKAAETGESSLAIEKAFHANGYDRYLDRYIDEAKPKQVIRVEAEHYEAVEGMEAGPFEDGNGKSGGAVLADETGTIRWKFEVKNAGLYNIKLRYFNVSGKNSDIERELRIDGQIPFAEANSIFLQRTWKSEQSEVERDDRGNDIRPNQTEESVWQEVALRDITGYYEEPYFFYFSEGIHTLSLTSLKEPVVIDWIELFQTEKMIDYKDQLDVYKQNGYGEASNAFVKLQAEDAVLKSSSTLYPIMDRTPTTEPYHVSKMRMNAIGGWNWRMPGQWIEWEIEVPSSGLYQIALKSKQTANRGLSSTRALYVDGKIPFREAGRLSFEYSGDWQMKVLGPEDQDPYLFYLTEGKHRLRLEVTLGELAPILRTVESSVLELNSLYRKIISFTGVVPDPFRDYQLEKRIPELIDGLLQQSETIDGVAALLEGYDGKTSERTALLQALSYQLKDMAERPETIPSRLEPFKTNVGALGTWMMQVKEQPLAIDYLLVTSPGADLPRAKATLFEKIVHENASFFASFFEDYASVGTVENEEEAVSVWVLTGRDQAQTLKKMIDNDFTSETGVPIKLQLVSANVLLSATLAGKGPDVAIQVGNDVPVNFAMRGALQDLSEFEDFTEVIKRFQPSAMVPYEYLGKYYALPEQQIFPVLFYREDILHELGLNVPETWEDVYQMIPVLQKNNLQFGLPQATLDASAVTDQMPPNPTYTMMLNQSDGELYQNDGKSSALDTEVSIQAFQKWTELYANYKLPIAFDFPNRFRTGEMPIGIADYSTYNHLSVSAPEIRGLWDFAPVPGVRLDNGDVRREAPGRGFGVVMFKDAKHKQAAWEFMKWWTAKEAQVDFGLEMEGLMGIAARYPTANMEALQELPWPTADLTKLMGQWQWVRGIPEVPGGYFTGRHLDNAFRRVVLQGDDARETIDLYVRYVNEEITIKRKEFGLPLEK
ncbi:extracellular solute-binding protein [Paenibacillus alkaliterrae]|uniref:extracellular solute-binding protein n=1 Tax=Paenibacillus alkaliterrae TaxID=320909 RepID=UPI001F1FE477|nr:extracellular solute-binding protein [Paenibacillus alkaliterrae]MCF2939248.1 extracellular solute-binding protein [Paenibacillus alkaliterrae]